MKQHDVALADFDALLFDGALDLGDVESGAFLDDVGAEIAGHVEQHTPGDERRNLLDAELLQTIGCGEVTRLKSVVVGPVDADMA